MDKPGTSRGGTQRWARSLAESSTPLFLLDARRRLILFSPGCTEWTGWTSDDVTGTVCDYVTEDDVHSVAAVLSACAPPAEVWQGAGCEVPVVLPHRTASPRMCRVQFQPLRNAGQQVDLVLGTFREACEPTLSLPATPAQQLHTELAALRHQVRLRSQAAGVIAASAPMHRVVSQLEMAAPSTNGVLFVGEPGTGREYLARVLHAQGPQAKLAFVSIDCRHTDSLELKRLLKQLREPHTELEALRPGTLYLREITQAPRDFQDRLAEWCAGRPARALPRLLASTQTPLAPLVAADRFDAGLECCLTTAVIEIPPLRQRPAELLPLAQMFLEERNRGAGRQFSGFQPDVIEAFRRYAWPGNVAELRATIDAAADQSTGPLITSSDLPLSFRAGEDARRHGPLPRQRLESLSVVLERHERAHIQAALQHCRQNLTKAAELLGLSRPKLYRRLAALGLLPAEGDDPVPGPHAR